MELIHHFFTLNSGAISFIYGLVFFVLGLAIALQSRASSRLDLARALTWLSAFGFTHGFHEWGDLFIPLQATYLSTGFVHFLYQVHLLLLGVSFAFLFEFGIALLRPLGRARWWYGVSGALLAVWIFVVFFPLATYIPNFDTWHNVSNGLARYFIGFPGAMVAAFGLRQHAYSRIQPLKVPHIFQTLKFAGWLLVVYGLVSGLVPPPFSFFPGNWLNTVTFEQIFLAPPALYRSIIGLGLAVSTIRALEVFDVETERMIEAMEQQQILSAERERIGRELHDGAIQKVYTAGLLVESAYKLVEPDHPVLIARLEKAVTVLNDAIGDLRKSLGELYTKPGELPIAEAIQALVDDPRFHSLVHIDVDLDLPETDHISPVRAEHVLAVVNEALSNVVRHSRATQATISARSQDNRFILTIEDDGVSLPKDYKAGYGLRNMRDRARLLGGNLDVSPANGRGTRITLNVPWKDEHG